MDGQRVGAMDGGAGWRSETLVVGWSIGARVFDAQDTMQLSVRR
jgi:hypothetical protein